MERLVVAAVIVVVAVAVATAVRRRRGPDAPVRTTAQLPAQLDRADFDRPDRSWLVVVFTSESCSVCASVLAKAQVLTSEQVAVQDVSFQRHRSLQERYRVDSVPSLVIADRDGRVHFARVGPITATDLWAAIAEVRSPGSVDTSGGCQSLSDSGHHEPEHRLTD
jgi:thioredoxin-related protein